MIIKNCFFGGIILVATFFFFSFSSALGVNIPAPQVGTSGVNITNGTMNHNELFNLDFVGSGHTGFSPDTWAYNMTQPFTNWLSTFQFNYNQTYLFNDTHFFYDVIGININQTWLDGIYCKLTGCVMTGDIVPDADATRSLGAGGTNNYAGVYTYLVGAPTSTGSWFDFGANFGVIGQIYDRTYTNILDLDANTFTGDCNTLDTYHASSFLTNLFTANVNAGGFSLTNGNIFSSNRYTVGKFSDNYAINLNYAPYIIINNLTDIPSVAFTQSMWVYYTGTLSEDYHELIVSNTWDDHQWIVTATGEIQYYTSCGTATTSDAGLVTGQWYHLVLRRDGLGNVKMWKNGVELTMDTYSLNCALTSSVFQIGRRNDGNHPFRGNIDEVTIWNTNISDVQVVALYNSGTGVYGNSTSLPSYSNVWAGYHMDDGLGATSVTDFSGGQDGTIAGSPTWVTGKITGAIIQPDTGEQVLVIGNITATENIKTSLIKLDISVLPSCSTNYTGSMGRNNTGTFGCNSTDWVRIF